MLVGLGLGFAGRLMVMMVDLMQQCCAVVGGHTLEIE